MGMTHHVSCPSGVPAWPVVRDWLAQHQFPVQMRMIDGQLAFPDEEPPADWREVRVGTSAGMVTIRRESAAVDIVTWGNADSAMLQAWNAIALAWAEVAGGDITTDSIARSASAFRGQVSLPPTLLSNDLR